MIGTGNQMGLDDYILQPMVAVAVTSSMVLLSIIEAMVLSRRGRYDWKSLGTSTGNLLFHWFVLFMVPYSISAPFVKYFSEHSLTKIPLNNWQAFLLLFLLIEFCHYWFHRASHRVRWFWLSHSVHHSSNDVTLAAGYRAGTLMRYMGSMLFFLPVFWIGFPVRGALAAITLNVWYQVFIHNSWLPKLGWLEYWFSTPSNHRVHHASNGEYLDANYGSVLIIFDRLFGTYVEERADNPCRYGLVNPQLSYNPLRVEFDPWMEFFRDLKSSRSVRELIGHVFFPPGWKPAAGKQRVSGGGEVFLPSAGLVAQKPGRQLGGLRPR